MRLSRLLLSVLVFSLGCSESDVTGAGEPDAGDPGPVGGHGKLTIDTKLSDNQVYAGQTVDVTCTVRDGSGEAVDKPTGLFIKPGEGLTVTDHALLTTKPGTWKVACKLLDPPIVDLDMETLVVVKGAPIKVEAKVDPASVGAGEQAQVTCIVTDALGNVLDEPTSVVAEGLTVDDHSISGTTPGTYEVRCVVDEHPKLENIPGSLVIEAAVPATIELSVTPVKSIYDPGNNVTFSWVVKDAFGNEIPDAPATLVGPTEGVKHLQDTKYKLLVDGHHTFTVTLDPPGPPLSDSLTLIVDGLAPEIVIDWPERGATIQGGATDDVVIQGHIVDAGGVKSFSINGQPVPLTEDGSFTFPMSPKWGLNLIDAKAVDIADHESRISPTYYYSTAFLSYEGATAGDVKLPDSVALLLGQPFLDDGDHDPAHPNDVATLLEMVLSLLDLNSLIPPINLPGFGTTLPGIINFSIPGPAGTTIDLAGDLGFEVIIGQPQLGSFTVSLDSREGGIDMGLGLGSEAKPAFLLPITIEVSVPVTMGITFDLPFGGGQQTIELDVVGKATIATGVQIKHIGVVTRLDIALAPGGQAEVSVADIEIQLQGVGVVPIKELVIDFGDLQLIPFLPPIPLKFDLLQFIPGITDLFDFLVLDPLIQAIEPQISGLIEPLIDQAIGAVIEPLFAALNLETTLPLPSLTGGPDMELGMAIGLSSIQFTDDGGTIGLGWGWATPKGVDRQPLGMPLRDGCLNGTGDGPFAYSWERSVGAAGRTDSLNELLFSLWWSGMLNNTLDLSGLGGGGGGGFSLDGVVITPTMLLPPLANDCSKGPNEVQVGDMYLDLDVNLGGFAIKAKIIMDLAVQVNFVGGPDGISLQIGQFTLLDIEVLDVGGGLGALFDVEDLLLGTLVPMIKDNVEGLTLGPIPLPGIPLDGILPGVPPGTEFLIGDFKVGKQPGYTIIAGDAQ
ncbi:MAG: hypothetical protein AMXMBFR64_21320 [Myxococcales bacterium]